VFSNKHIVVTGGSSGLGLELARRFAREGARLTLIARDPVKLDKAADAIRARQAGAQVAVEPLDVRDEAATRATMDRIAAAGHGIDVLVNSAGILREGRFEELPMEAFREVMEINYFGLLTATRAALPHLKKSRGRLVNVASMAGLTGCFGYTPYCASKHALVGLSEALRYELQPQGVTVHLVIPGEFDSPMVDDLDRYRTPENKAHVLTIPKATVGAIADATMAGIRAGRFFIVTGVATRTVATLVRHFPGLARAMGDRTIARVQRAMQAK